MRKGIADWRQPCIHLVQALVLHIVFVEMAQSEFKCNVSNVSGAIL